MRTFLSGLLLFISASLFAQANLNVTDNFKKINTVAEAQQYIDANPTLKPALMSLSYGKDTSLIEKRLLRQKKGDVFSVGYVTYKVLDATENVAYRANYIFLDGSSLTPSQVDSLKKIITQKASSGTAFEQLSDQYTMDGNNTHGDTGWFFGEEMMPKEFQEAVSKHKLGDIFYVDVPEKQWHYIVKKTYDDQVKKDIKVLRANGR
ncbi:MAG: peptidylprolyl isomerase [Williamsia sp.]|nr:peptidylprolyl isomerase [Williamsia sp.]